ncbi:MAG: hypothetical protein RL141_144 [Candidatus Parcubacteria bacterium]|jgi:predicted membrane chloride channel (bestrophin family)
MEKQARQMSRKNRIYNFFEQPESLAAKTVQAIIFFLIILSVGVAVIDFGYPDLHRRYFTLLETTNHIILAVFTVEYLVRLLTAPKKGSFFIKPMNMVDFFSVFPNYLELFLHVFIDTTELRVLRIVRLLRFTRFLRVFKLFKYNAFFKKVFSYQQTILQSITPVISAFVALKIGIIVLEHYGWWFVNPDLGELFAIIGFALGIILSQKIASSYDKFTQVEEATVRLYGSLQSLALILNRLIPGVGDTACRAWAKQFLALLENPKADNARIVVANHDLYAVVKTVEETPSDLSVACGDICRDAALCLSKKVRLTPKPYDVLLQQSTILYLGLITLFMPGFTGLMSVFIATYILYGMYNLTQDIDSIIGGDFTLISIDISELKHFAAQ